MDKQELEQPSDEPREAVLIALLADIIERLCVTEQPATVVQSVPEEPAKAA